MVEYEVELKEIYSYLLNAREVTNAIVCGLYIHMKIVSLLLQKKNGITHVKDCLC